LEVKKGEAKIIKEAYEIEVTYSLCNMGLPAGDFLSQAVP
jgi:hypothetical protein